MTKRKKPTWRLCQLRPQGVEWNRDEKNQIINRALKIESPSASSRVCKKKYPPTTPWELVGKKMNASHFPFPLRHSNPV